MILSVCLGIHHELSINCFQTTGLIGKMAKLKLAYGKWCSSLVAA